jgi:hypothetical protein
MAARILFTYALVVAVDDESCTLTMPIADAARQPLGMLRGKYERRFHGD